MLNRIIEFDFFLNTIFMSLTIIVFIEFFIGGGVFLGTKILFIDCLVGIVNVIFSILKHQTIISISSSLATGCIIFACYSAMSTIV